MREVNMESLADRFKWKLVDVDVLPRNWAVKMQDDPGYMLAPAFAPILQAMGTEVEHYQSDVVYEILNTTIEFGDLLGKYKEYLRSGGQKWEVMGAQEYAVSILGLRQYGVDGASFVESRTRDGDTSEYRSLWKITVEFALDQYKFRTYKRWLDD